MKTLLRNLFLRATLFALTLLVASQVSAEVVDYGFKILGQEITSENYYKIYQMDGVSGWVKYDTISNTLTLQACRISDKNLDNNSYGIQICSNDSLKINLSGNIKIETYYPALATPTNANSNLHTFIVGKGGDKTLQLKSYGPSVVALEGLAAGSCFILEDCRLIAEGTDCGINTDSLIVRYSRAEAYGGGTISEGTVVMMEGSSVLSATGCVYDERVHLFLENPDEADEKPFLVIERGEIDNCGFSICGTAVTGLNRIDIARWIEGVSGKVTYDPSTATLHLENATIEYSSGDGIRNDSLSGLKIDLVGTNKINAGQWGLSVAKPTTITGTGTLSVNGNLDFIEPFDGTGGICIDSTSLLIDACEVSVAGPAGIMGSGKGDTVIVHNAYLDMVGSKLGTLFNISSLQLDGCELDDPYSYSKYRQALLVRNSDHDYGAVATYNIKIQPTYVDVILENYGDTKISTIKKVYHTKEVNLAEAKEFVENLPGKVLEHVTLEEAKSACSQFAALGCAISYCKAGSWTQGSEIAYGLSIAGVAVTSKNRDDLSVIEGVSGTVKYDPSIKTLYLNDAKIDCRDKMGSYVYGITNESVDSLNIVVTGNNTIMAFGAIYVLKPTTITGGGLLSISDSKFGLVMFKATLAIERCTVNADCSEGGVYGDGLSSEAELVVRGASMTCTGSNRGSLCLVWSLTLDDCKLTTPDNAVYDSEARAVVLNGENVTSRVVIEDDGLYLYDVVLEDYGTSEMNVIKLVKDLKGLSLIEAKKFVESAPVMLDENLKMSEAQNLCSQIVAIGGTAKMYPAGTWSPIGVKPIETDQTTANSGIYSIDGKYLGNDYDRLSKGLYIKDGKKVLKLR